jgi:hypothetical protein
VGRDVQDPGVVPEDGLGPVAVVDVEVDDDHPLAPFGQGGGPHGDVVDHAETHRLLGQGVVSRRPGGHERSVALARRQGVDGGQHAAGGQQCRVPRPRSHDGVGIESAPAAAAELLHQFQIPLGVDTYQLLGRGPSRGQRHHGVAQPGVVDPSEGGRDPSRSFGMAPAGVMVIELRMAREKEHDECLSRPAWGRCAVRSPRPRRRPGARPRPFR